MQKIISFIFVLLITLQLCGSFPVHADENTTSGETIILKDTFYCSTTDKYYTANIPFDPEWFNGDARIYNHDLAKLSIGLATASFRPHDYDSLDVDPGAYLYSFLEQAGFTDMRSDDYDKDPSMYTVSTMMAHRTIKDGDEPYELIAVGICGQGYLDEWESNFSIGLGEHPEGFYSASKLVYDRVFGYIASNHLSGHLKIWISGFSRAAAISNITAAYLSDSDQFAKEDVFAYTFATPNTVRMDDIPAYENIFNICGKMDPVTCIPFTDWGYARYGTTLYTPALETDSDFLIKRQKANVLYKEMTGISYWNNSDINRELRVVLDCLLRICPNVETYHISLEDNLISLWEKHDAYSVFNKLIEMSEDPILINEKNRDDANLLLNRFSYLIMDYLAQNNSFRRYNRKATVGSNFMQAHTPELYMSWILTSDSAEELYSIRMDYVQLFVEVDGLVKLFQGDVLMDSYSDADEYVGDDHRYIGLNDEQTIVLIPSDQKHEVRIVSDNDEPVDVLLAKYKAGSQAPSMTTIAHYRLKRGEPIVIAFSPSGTVNYVTTPESAEMKVMTQENYLSNSQLVNFVYKNNLYMNWKDIIMYVYVFTLVSVCFVFFLITMLIKYLRHLHRKKRGIIDKDTPFRPLPIICFFLIQQIILIMQLDMILYDFRLMASTIYKILISLLLMIIAYYGYRRKKDRFHRFIIYSMFLLCLGDILLYHRLELSGLFFIAANLLLTYSYVKEDRPDLVQILAFILFALISGYVILIVPDIYWTLRAIGLVYAISACALVASSYVFPGRTFRGSLLLAVSTLAWMISVVKTENPVIHIINTLAYYIAVCTLASTGSGYSRKRNNREEVIEEEGLLN